MKTWIFGVAALAAAMCFGATTEDGVTKERRGALGPNDTVVTDVDTTGIVAARTYTKDEIDRRIATNAPVRSVNGKSGAVTLGAGDVGALPNNRDDLKASANFRNAVWDVQIRGGGIDANAVDALANSAVVTNALTVATTNRVASHVASTNNPHAVTAKQVGALPLVEDYKGNKTAVTIGGRAGGQLVGAYSLANGIFTTASGDYSHAEGGNTTASGGYSHAEGGNTIASGDYSHAEGAKTTASGDYSHASGYMAQTRNVDAYSFAWNGCDNLVDPYLSHGPGTYNINPFGGLGGFWIGEQTLAEILTNKADKADISATNTTFSNAVLAVGLNIDTNAVAVLNDISATFGGFPIEGTATTVGGLLAALAAAAAWLKKNKVGSFASVGGATATVENGVAKLSEFFTESNSLLNGRLSYERNETGLKDRAFNALTFDGTEYNLSTALAAVTPTASGQPRDLLIVATATAATTISFTAGTIKGDKPTIDGAGTWLITLTEYASGVWYCRQIKMEDAA